MQWGLLKFQDLEPGIQRVSLNIKDLFHKENNEKELTEFKERLCQFRKPDNSDAYTACIYEMEDDLLTYETESIIPKTKKEKRTPLLLLLGNPASHSVKERMFFSFEYNRQRNRQEHRFWKTLKESGIFAIPLETKDLDKRNESRKQKLFDLSYDPPFQIGLAVFYSMPSPSSGKWAGVAGLRRLFKKEAFERITCWEKKRVENLIKEFVTPRGLVVAFQKDAYLRLKSTKTPDYSLKEAMAGKLKSKCHCDDNVTLYCFPPTRLMQKNLILLRNLKLEHTLHLL